MADLPSGRICHLSAGRLRIRIAEKRRDDAFFRNTAARLSGWDSVERVEVNPLTASVLVHFSNRDRLFADMDRHNDLFAIAADPADEHDPAALTEKARRLWGRADAVLRRWTGGSADVRNATFLVLVASALYQLRRGQVMPPALTSLWYAGDMLSLWRATPDETPPVAAGKRVAGD